MKETAIWTTQMSEKFLTVYKQILASPIRDPMEEDNSVVAAVLAGLGAKVCSLWKVNENAGTVSVMTRVIAAPGAPIQWQASDFVHPIAGSMTELVLRELKSGNKPFNYIGNVSSEPWHAIHNSKAAVRLLELRSLVSIPVLSEHRDRRIAALLNIYTNKPLRLKSEDATTLSAFVSTAIRNTQGLVRERITADLMQTFSSTSDISATLANASRSKVARAFSAELCQVFLWSRHNTHLIPAGAGENDLSNAHLPDQGLVGWCARTGRSVILPNVLDQNEAELRRKQQLRGVVTTRETDVASMYVPIFRNGSVQDILGVIRFVNKRSKHGNQPDFFSDDDLELAQYVSTLLSFFIEKKIQDEQKQDFLTDLAHEVLQPAVGIRGAAKYLLNRDDFDRSRLYQVIQDVSLIAELQISLVHSLYRAWEVAAGIPNPEPSEFELLSVLFEARQTIIPLARIGRVSFHNIKVTGVNPRLCMVKNALSEVFVNLLSNAVKYFDPDKRDAFSVILRAEQCAIGVRVSVEDSGIGVTPHERDAIFRRGYRGVDIRRISVRGLGIGLFVSTKIVRDFGGTLSLERHKNPTKFCVEIPSRYIISWGGPTS